MGRCLSILTSLLPGEWGEQTVEFSGMTAPLVYHGELAPCAGLLSRWEVMPWAGKTAFGFGRLHPGYAAGYEEDKKPAAASLPSRPAKRSGKYTEIFPLPPTDHGPSPLPETKARPAQCPAPGAPATT
jgi:hypothetical protein